MNEFFFFFFNHNLYFFLCSLVGSMFLKSYSSVPVFFYLIALGVGGWMKGEALCVYI